MNRLDVTEKIIETKVAKGLKWADVAFDPNDAAVKIRREMEAAFGRRNV